jgi:O-succinylbenzoic acid--CoA ligase
MTWSDTADGNRSFWESDACYVAESPHRPGDADGLAEFAATSEATRRLLYFQTSAHADIPKWIGIGRSAFLHSARAVNQHLKSSSQDRWLIPQSLHEAGRISLLARCHESGASYVPMERKWSAKRFVECCRDERITLATLVPSQVCDLVAERLEAPPDLRAVVVGGSALPSSKEGYGHAAIALGWPLLQSHSTAEACFPIAMEPLARLRTGFDPETLEVLPDWSLETDRNGILYVRGAALPSGYAIKRDWRKRIWIAEDVKLCMSPVDRGHPLWRWEPIDPESGVITSEHVQLWPDGARTFLRFLARGSTFVKVHGELVNLAILQPRLEGLAIAAGLGFGNVIIFPLPDDHGGNRLVLVGQLPVLQIESLRFRFNKQVAGLEKLHESRSVPAIPRTNLGKVDSVALNRLLGASATM